MVALPASLPAWPPFCPAHTHAGHAGRMRCGMRPQTSGFTPAASCMSSWGSVPPRSDAVVPNASSLPRRAVPLSRVAHRLIPPLRGFPCWLQRVEVSAGPDSHVLSGKHGRGDRRVGLPARGCDERPARVNPRMYDGTAWVSDRECVPCPSWQGHVACRTAC